MAGLDDHVVALLNHAPELVQSPGLTTGLAQGITASTSPVDPAAVGQSASLALTAQGIQQAQQDVQQASPHHSSGWFSSVGSFFGHVGHDVKNDVVGPAVRDVLSPIAQTLNVGIATAQHQYRYIHDVWQRHGALAALTSTPTFWLAQDSPYADSYKATSNGAAYRDAQGWHVSPGRDLDRLVGYLTGTHLHENKAGTHVEGAWWGNVLSGAGDATFDVSMDPVLKLGSAIKAARVAARTPRLLAGIHGLDDTEEAVQGVTTASKPAMHQDGFKASNIQDIYQNNAGVRDAFGRIAEMKTKDVLTNYPMLRPLAAALGRASTPQEVADTFEQALTARNYSFAHYGLPHTSLTRRLLGGVGVNIPNKYAVATAIQDGLTVNKDDPIWKRAVAFHRYVTDDQGNVQVFHEDGMPTNIPIVTPTGIGKVVNAFTAYQPFAFDSKTLDISGHGGDPLDPEFIRGLYSSLRYSQNASTAKAIVARYLEAPTLGEKVNIIKNGYADTLRAAGLPDESPYFQHVVSQLDYLLKQVNGGMYALDEQGRIIRMLDDAGNPLNRGLFVNQTGNIAFLDYNKVRQAVYESKGTLWNKVGKVDDFLYRHITSQFFKRLILLSLGFATRVASGELIPAVFSQDARRVLGAGLQAGSAKLYPAYDDMFGNVERGADGAHPLAGSRVTTSGIRHVGTLQDVNPETGEATIAYPDIEGPVQTPITKVTFYHGDIRDEELRQAAQDLGASITKDEVGHIRAAAGKALYGVGRALTDRDYRDMALMNILAFDGHIVPPALASVHDEPRGIQGINRAVRKQAIKAGMHVPRGAGLGPNFQMWDFGKNEQPLFWKYALTEAADDPGIRAAARAFSGQLRVMGGHDLGAIGQSIAENEGATYNLADRAMVEHGYPVAVHPAHESKVPLEDFRPGHIQQYIEAKAPELSQEGHHLGVWVSNGHVYFDVVKTPQAEEEARQLALERGEKAIYNLQTGDEIDLTGEYASERARLRRRRKFIARNPVESGPVQFGAVEPDHGLAGGAGTEAGERAQGAGSAAGSLRADLGRPLGEAQKLAATRAAIKADRDWMESEDPRAVRARVEMAHYSTDPEKYSGVRVEGLKGLIMGQHGHVNSDVLDALARGETPTIQDLAEKEHGLRPYAVKGRELKPQPVIGTLDKIIAGGWDGIHAVINSLSRAPIYTMFVTDEYKFLKPWVAAGRMTKAEAHSIATVRALDRTLPLIHNTLLRSKASLVFRNVFPFYFAQEQAYKRYGRALFSNPVAFRKAQLGLHALHSSGALQTDPSTGQTYFVYPGAGDVPFLMSAALGNLGITPMGGIPATVEGDTISLRSVVPEMVGPGVGPVVAVPLKAIAEQFHPADPYVREFLGVFGGGAAKNSDLFDELIPNTTLRRLIEATPLEEKRKAFTSTYAMVAAYHMHEAMPLWQQAEAIDPRSMDSSVPRDQLDPRAQAILSKADRIFALPNADASDKQASQDRLKNETRVTLLFKAAFGFLSPLSPTVEVGDVQLHSELDDDIAKLGMIPGLQAFMAKHPDATPDTVFQSDNSATGTSPPATAAAEDWINSNKGFVSSHQLAAAYLIPQTPGKYSSDAYNEELLMHLRAVRSPQQFTDALYTAMGNAEFIPSLQSYEAQKAQAQAEGNSALESQLSSAWQAYFTQLQQRNPVWYDNEFAASKTTTAQQAYNQLVSALASKNPPDSPMVPVAQQLIQDYQGYQQQVALAQAGTGAYTKTQLDQSWKDYLDSYVAQNPEAEALVYGVFRRLGSNG